MNLIHFPSAAAFRTWLERHHATEREVWVGFYKKDSGRTGITYGEAVDEALCFGWIDGIKKRVDDLSYTNRFTPRKPTSNWSAVNIRRYQELRKAGRVAPPGRKAFARRDKQAVPYSTANRPGLSAAYVERIKANKKAWAYFRRQTPSYRRTTAFWVMSAKQEATRERRLTTLIACCAKQQPIPPLAWAKPRKKKR